MFPQGQTPPFYPIRNMPYSPNATSHHLQQSRFIPTNALPQPLPPNILTKIVQANDRALELLHNHAKSLSDIHEIKRLEDFKARVPFLLSNLKELEDQILDNNLNFGQFLEMNKGYPKDNEKNNSEFVDKSHIRSLEDKVSNLLQENEKMKVLNEQLKKENIETLNKKGQEIETLINSVMEKDEELQKFGKLRLEKEAIEKNIEKLVGLNEQVKKNYEQCVIDLDVHKSRLNILMDINSELRSSLEIVLHENRKLNRLLSPLKTEHKNKQKEIYDSELEFILRNKDEIDEFLYEFNTTYIKQENANNFDHTDIIFVIGSSGLLPWTTSAQKNINIINGNGHGSKLSEIFKLNKELTKLELTDYFLDNVTGDIYNFNRETEEWYPKGNVGLHHRRSAEEYQTLGKYIVKAPIYRAKKINELVEIYKAKTTETIIYIKKNYMNHWAVKNIYPLEFKAQLLGEWDCHNFSFVNKDKMFFVLADSEKGPAILDFGNILALHCNVEKNYPSTIPFINNFIDRSIDIMKSNKLNSVKKIIDSHPTSKVFNLITFAEEKNSKKIKVRTAIKHQNNEDIILKPQNVGYSFAKNKFPQIIVNNAVAFNLESQKNMLKNQIKNKKKHQKSSMSNVRSLMKLSENSVNFRNLTESSKVLEDKEEEILSKKKVRTFLHPTLSNDHLKDEVMWLPGNLSQTFYKKIIMKRDFSQTKANEPYFTSTLSNKSSWK